MTYDDLLMEAERQMHKHRSARSGRREKLLSWEEIAVYVPLHKQMGRDIALESRKDVLFIDVQTDVLYGFIEVCADDPSVNGILFTRKPSGLYAALVWGGFPPEIDWMPFHESIVDVWRALPDEYKTARPGDVGTPPGR